MSSPSNRSVRCGVLAFAALAGLAGVAAQSSGPAREAPRFWNDRELADWATPIAALNVRPGHFSEREYYAAPEAEWVRTYPVYFPGREPAGYWETLRAAKPQPLVAPGARSDAAWINTGRRIFEEMDVPDFRSTDPEMIAIARSAEQMVRRGVRAQQDGRVLGLRWVPTSKGLALGTADCSFCHTRAMPDGSLLNGAPFNLAFNGVFAELGERGLASFLPGDSPSIANWRQFTTPWIAHDIHDGLKSMTASDAAALFFSAPPGTFARFNGSPYYMTKVPDLIGIKDRTYIDHTGTHRLRGAADVMRYAALVSCCDVADFGSHRILPDAQRKIAYRMPDELLFGLAQYLLSLEPPPNPHAGDPRAAAGRDVFQREGCASCHTPPLYTNNKLTLAHGYVPPPDHPNRADVMPISVGTDSNLALKTRKGTGFYKVPSLKGVWYRGMFNHDGSVTTLEEWFDPERLREDFVPSGFVGYKVTRRAVPGHEYGLRLTAEDKAALIAFLKTL
jgi:hypothetical protein